MVALRMVGLAVIATAVVAVGFLAVYSLMRMGAEGEARGAAIKVSEAAGTVVSTGNQQSVKVRIPSGYTMRFIDNHVWIDGYRAPPEGLALDFADDSPELGAGEYELVISVQDSKLIVWT